MDEKKDIEELIKVILAQSSERLEQDLSDFESLHSKLTKHQVLKTFNDYLRILFIHKYPISYPLIQRYGKFSKQGRAGSDFEVAFYLKRMCSNLKDPSVTGNLEIQEERALRNLKINHELLTLSERIHILFLMNQDTIKYSSYIELLEKGLFEIAPEEFEKKLLQGIPSGKYIPGYEFGIARYLIYFVYKNLKDEGKDVSRFNRLFL